MSAMQNTNWPIVQCVRVPTKVANVGEDPIAALVQAMQSLSRDEIEALEDEINFFAFSGLKGDLVQDILHKAADLSERSSPSDYSGYAHKTVGRKGRSKHTANASDKALECAFG